MATDTLNLTVRFKAHFVFCYFSSQHPCRNAVTDGQSAVQLNKVIQLQGRRHLSVSVGFLSEG